MSPAFSAAGGDDRLDTGAYLHVVCPGVLNMKVFSHVQNAKHSVY